MEEKKKTTVTKFSKNLWLALLAYIGIGCIAIALLLNLIFEGNVAVASAFKAIGEVIAYIICILLAYNWVKTHRHIAWIVCYVIFVVTIIVLFILNVI
ncbi:MAG: hypothetical protein IJX25_01130 [Clostridia bacterium]|nr:hypothetical protein [Clostridia bacterium]MBQ8792987.1 hypothetical protein [Clostridia bacterium]